MQGAYDIVRQRIRRRLADATATRSIGHHPLRADREGVQSDGWLAQRRCQLPTDIFGGLKQLGIDRKAAAHIARNAAQSRILQRQRLDIGLQPGRVGLGNQCSDGWRGYLGGFWRAHGLS